MPIVAVATIVIAVVVAAVLAGAVAVIAVQLRRTSAVLADVDAQLGTLPPALRPLGPAIERANLALAAVASSFSRAGSAPVTPPVRRRARVQPRRT
ncbi:MAG: hypothetical protein V7605_880 [Acidimicrobiaceae bacterium]|jgi:hypothetical protein